MRRSFTTSAQARQSSTSVQEAVQALVRAGLRNPFRVNVAVSGTGGHSAAKALNSSQKTPVSLQISHMIVPTNHKVPTLLSILQQARAVGEKVIVYFLTCASVEYMAAVLPRLPGGEGLRLLGLHGGLKQRKVLSCRPCAVPLNQGKSPGNPQTRGTAKLHGTHVDTDYAAIATYAPLSSCA